MQQSVAKVINELPTVGIDLHLRRLTRSPLGNVTLQYLGVEQKSKKRRQHFATGAP
jgi:uncharacterized protein (DUF2342 family)